MHDEPRDIPPPNPPPTGAVLPPDDVTGKAVAALIFGVLGLAHFCPCIGPALAIGLGYGERSGVGRAAIVLGAITLFFDLLVIPALALWIAVWG